MNTFYFNMYISCVFQIQRIVTIPFFEYRFTIISIIQRLSLHFVYDTIIVNSNGLVNSGVCQ